MSDESEAKESSQYRSDYNSSETVMVESYIVMEAGGRDEEAYL